MGQKDKFEILPENLELVPLDEQHKTTVKKSTDTPAGQANFTIDKRSYVDRRKANDRRETIRFQDERRTEIDRRASSANWDTL